MDTGVCSPVAPQSSGAYHYVLTVLEMQAIDEP